MHFEYSVVGQLCEIYEKQYNMGPLMLGAGEHKV